MGPSDSLTLKNIIRDTKIIVLCALVQKLWPKKCLQNNGEHNVTIFGQHTDC